MNCRSIFIVVCCDFSSGVKWYRLWCQTMDTDGQGTHRTYRQRGGLYMKLFNLYLHFTNLPSLKLPICFTCKTYLENFQKDRQLNKRENETLYSDCISWNFSLSTPLFLSTEIVVSHATVFFNICAITHRRVLQRCVAAPKKNGCLVDSKTTVQKSTTEKSCTRYLLICKYFGSHRFKVVTP